MGLKSKHLKRKIRDEPSSEDESEMESEQEFHEEEDTEEDDEGIDGDGIEDDVKEIEAQKDAELEELEEEYMNLRNGEQDLVMNLKRHKDEDLRKGQAVRNQKVLWDKTLELRFLLQKVFLSSNKLPQEPLRTSFCGSDEAVGEAYSDLITSSEKTLGSLVELQEALLENNPSIVQVTEGNKGDKSKDESVNSDIGNDKEWSRIQLLHSSIAPFRNKSIDKWQSKSQVATGVAGFRGKLQAFSQNISEQVSSYMRDPSKMVRRMQLKRPVVGVFGTVTDASSNIKDENANEDGDPELLDDSEFYQQLLNYFLDSCDPTSSEATSATYYALKQLQTKKRKVVDRRASKCRKIRYHVHEKIVNFMAPVPMNVPDMAPILFENLFGRKQTRPSPA